MSPNPTELRSRASTTSNAITALELRMQALELDVTAMNDVHEAAQTLAKAPRKPSAKVATTKGKKKRARKSG